MEKILELCCSKHLDVTLKAKINSEWPLVLSVETCRKCIADAEQEIDDEILREKLLEHLRKEL
jgi:hypothetical protein